MELKVKKLNPDAKLPTRAHPGDAGMDLYAAEAVTIAPGERAVVNIGISMAIPEGHVGLVWDKSGLAVKKGITILAGVIDEGYRGEIGVVVLNTSNEDHTFAVADKVAQMLIQKFAAPEIIEGDLDNTARGEGGFGSTGHR